MRAKYGAGLHAQSAMEYLMTYAWAILIISVVIAALFQLGILNGSAFSSRAKPGSCSVYKNANSQSSLAGQCNGELPQYVASFNGQSSQITGTASFSTGTVPFTLIAWINTSSTEQGIFYLGACGNTYGLYNRGLYFDSEHSDDASWSTTINDGSWHMVSMSYDGATSITFFNNGQFQSATLGSSTSISSSAFLVGNRCGSSSYFNGQMANIQLYNTSLPESDIQKLYLEGIGGAPIDLKYLAGWWPLNGNSKDYSGNANDGTASGVSYTDTWANGYTAP